MLEEAAGTRMYETKKDAALRTLEKKQVKVSEIEKVRSPTPQSSSLPRHAVRNHLLSSSSHRTAAGILFIWTHGLGIER